MGLFSDNLNDVLARDMYDEFFKLLLYTLELWLCCGAFLLLACVQVKLRDLLMVTLFFLDFDFFGRLLNKARHRHSGQEKRKVVLITSGDLVRRAIAKICKGKTDTEYEIIAICLTDNADFSRFENLQIPLYRTTDPDLLDKLVTLWIDDAFFLAGMKTGYLSTLMEDFVTMGITVHYSMSAMNDFASVNIGVQSLGDYKVITNSSKLISYRAEFVKRAMDILGALAGLMVTAVAFVFIAPAIYIKSPGPIFFKQKRIGRNGKILYTILSLKCDKIWDVFFVLAKPNGGRRCRASLTAERQSQGGKDTHRCRILD